jgi:glycosyltransferase involved in cell wall biosynthesis
VLTVAYLANQFPVAVEPYVGNEIEELRRRGVRVLACSARRVDSSSRSQTKAFSDPEILCLQPIRAVVLLSALLFAIGHWKNISDLIARVMFEGNEPILRRMKALAHTGLGAYYAELLKNRGVDHIHAHHGYFGSWIAMIAARLLGVGFSLTLHGSDLLLHASYLDTKLKSCRFCLTVSEYNRHYILESFPEIDTGKIFVARMGVDVPKRADPIYPANQKNSRRFSLLAVGRLHAVKDHAFLIRACARLRDYGLNFECAIAGEGPERPRLESAIRNAGLEDRVRLLGHVQHEKLNSLYCCADLIVLTSRSEGIPLVLMEAMALTKIVLAPAITGIPELVIPGKTGFLYELGNLEDFVYRALFVHALTRSDDRATANRLSWMRHTARAHVANNFNREKNLTRFADLFLQRVSHLERSSPYEDPVLQQI